MGDEPGRKRSRHAFERGHVAESTPSPRKDPKTGKEEAVAVDDKITKDAAEWQVVEPRNKRRKKQDTTRNYPTITHSSHARLQSFVKIGDLQNLVLYFLADGNAPQWCSVRHHNNVHKVVVLMVPGIEAGMFTGKIQLSDRPGRIAGDEQSEKGVAQISSDSNSARSGESPSLSSPVSIEPGRKTNITPDDYYPVKLSRDRLPEPLQPLAEMFEHIWPVKTPGDDRSARMHSPLAAMLIAPLAKTKEEKTAKGPQFPVEGRNWKNQHTAVTSLLASPQELADENYVLHPTLYESVTSVTEEAARREANGTNVVNGWLDLPVNLASSDGKASANGTGQNSFTAGRKVLAMDCEMCITSSSDVKPQVFSLTRISIIDWNGHTILDEYVKPAEPITDYLTPYSGITPETLKDVTTSLTDIQSKLKHILTSDTILIGHSLNSDLNALRITFPSIIDTALLYPHPRGPPLKSSLKWLSQKYLAREIQKGHGSTGHNSIEDAQACLDLVKQKCEKGKLWGTSEANGESIFKRLARAPRHKPRDSRDSANGGEHRTGAVVDWGDPTRGYGGSATVAIGCRSDDDVVRGIRLALGGDTAGGNSNVVQDSMAAVKVPPGGCDFVWARLRGLEAYRGWWSKAKMSEADLSANENRSQTDSTTSMLADVTSCTMQHIREIYESLPACTAFIVYSGSGDPRELQKMQEMQRTFRDEYRVKKWDQLSVKWTDTEEQMLKEACEQARRGCAFVTVK